MLLSKFLFNNKMFSAQSIKRYSCTLVGLGQGCKIFTNFLRVKKCVINVTTNWQDHCEINCGITNSSGVLTEENLHCDSFGNEEFNISQMLNESVESSRAYGTIKMQVLSDSTLLISAADTDADFIYLSLKVPENFNMSVQARELEIIVRNKFQGDFSITSESGSVTIDKMRGSDINIDAGLSSVKVRKLLEGNANIIGSDIIAKMINGDRIRIDSRSGIDIEAIYSKSASVACHRDGNISIGLLQGNIEAVTTGRGNTTISNIDGSFNVISQDGDVSLQINKLDQSLSSSASALRGNLTAKVSPDVAVNVLCESTSPQNSRSVLTISSDTYVPYLDTVSGGAQCEDAKIVEWISTLPSTLGQRKVGRLTGKSSPRLRNPHFSSQRSSVSGKINLQGAEEQSLRTFQRGDVNGELFRDGDGGEFHEDEDVHLNLKASGNVCVESLSWMEAIRRKYGFLDSASSLNDDDIVSSPNIPFCRQGHSQITIGHTTLSSSQHSFKEQILVFGGKGINYKQPDTMFMNDLWILKLFDTRPLDHGITRTEVSTNEQHENEQDKRERIDPFAEQHTNNMIYGSSVPYFEWRQIDQLSSSVWPNRRWNFGFTSVYMDDNILPSLIGRTSNDDIMKSNSKLLIYGGESDLYRGFYSSMSSGLDNTKFLSDLWLLVNETYWMRIYDENDFFLGSSGSGETTNESVMKNNISMLQYSNSESSSAGRGRYNMLRQQFPGPRKGAMLVTMPQSQTVVLFGGEGLFVEDKRESTSLRAPSKESVRSSQEVSGEGTIIKRITVTCISDVFTLNVTAAILSHNSQTEVRNDDDGFHKWDIWSRGMKYSDPCLMDAAAVGIVDPVDKAEKMLVFGGRYIPSSSSSATTSPSSDSSSRMSGSPSSQSSQNDILLGDSSYVYNRNILLYDPLQKKWSSIPASGCWPAGRHDHSLSYSHDTQSVFLSGGRQDGAVATKMSQSSSSSNNTDSNYSDCDQQCNTENADSSTEMELWTFDLATRSWKRQCPRQKLNSRKLPESDSIVAIGGQWGSKGAGSSGSDPDGRYSHGMSLLRASRSGGGDEGGQDNDLQVVVFGGQYHPYSYKQQQQEQSRRLLGSDQILERHSEMNDVWMYRLSDPVNRASPLDEESGWVLVSSGGCHVGDNGIVQKPIVDTSALFLVYALAGSALFGILFYHAVSKLVLPKSSAASSHSNSRLFHIEMRSRNGYSTIPDEAVVQ